MASQLAKAVREGKESTSYDLKGSLSQEQAQAVIEAAFKEPLPLEEMIKITLVVGAGKLARQKYDDNLGKWVCNALRDVGYEEDRGASLALECAGSFKFQHDTGKNEKFVHVFPKIKGASAGGAGAGEAGDGAEVDGASAGPLTAEWLCVASNLSTFKDMSKAKLPAWIEKRRCAAMLKEEVTKLEAAEMKLTRMETLSPEEQRLIDNVDRDLIASKVAHLTECMKAMVDEGQLTSAERKLVLEQVSSKLEAVEAEEAACGADQAKKKAKLGQAKEQIKARKDKISEIKPIQHPLQGEAAIKTVWRKLHPMEKLLEKAGPKGRWSSKLSQAEVEKLGEKDELDEQLAGLLASARHWFEEEDEFNARVSAVKSTLTFPKKAASKPPSAPASDGWATVGRATGKKGGGRGGGGGAARSNNPFAALG